MMLELKIKVTDNSKASQEQFQNGRYLKVTLYNSAIENSRKVTTDQSQVMKQSLYSALPWQLCRDLGL